MKIKNLDKILDKICGIGRENMLDKIVIIYVLFTYFFFLFLSVHVFVCLVCLCLLIRAMLPDSNKMNE